MCNRRVTHRGTSPPRSAEETRSKTKKKKKKTRRRRKLGRRGVQDRGEEKVGDTGPVLAAFPFLLLLPAPAPKARPTGVRSVLFQSSSRTRRRAGSRRRYRRYTLVYILFVPPSRNHPPCATLTIALVIGGDIYANGRR